ncbi:MAG: histidine kinase [Pseudomonadales bacterium]|nr:histidine kinase [Pseudomonadales bacterium]
MKKWPSYFPTFMSRLWFQLAISYTLLSFCALVVLYLTLLPIKDYKNFNEAMTLENIEQAVMGELLIVSQAILYQNNPIWWGKAQAGINEALLHIGIGSGVSLYRITNTSDPKIYIEITDEASKVLWPEGVQHPPEIVERFAAQKNDLPPHDTVKWLVEKKVAWINIPITDEVENKIGYLKVLFVAEFDLGVQIQTVLDFLLKAWRALFVLAVPIGIACGLLASRYVTTQLRKIDDVTDSWRRGNFDERIELPVDDVLVRHSNQLNDMAQDLDLYLNLKQNLAVSDERNRVARELHDTVKQKLFALGLQLATAKTKPVIDEANEHICEAESITREAQQDLMEIITQLRPAGTTDIPLFDRIEMIAAGFRRRFDVSIDIIHANSSQFNGHTEHHVLRIVQESLINAVRHGQASQITIALKIEKDTVFLSISDNGGGFETDKKNGGFGITSMRDRVRDLTQGTFEIQSSVGSGTQITISWKNAI